jgi:amidohydrolase
MIAAGVLDTPRVDAAFTLHVWADAPAGRLASRPGPHPASSDVFELTIRGRGGHAALPHLAVDPVVVAAYVVVGLQTLVSREVAPDRPAVVTVASLAAGTTANVIPDTAILTGTLRAMDPSVGRTLARRIGELATSVAAGMRASATLTFTTRCPPVVNGPAMAALAAAAFRGVTGTARIIPPAVAIMVAEDFAYVLERVPGATFLLGVRAPTWEHPKPLHTAAFDLDEDALPVGVAALVAVALRVLNGGPGE